MIVIDTSKTIRQAHQGPSQKKRRPLTASSNSLSDQTRMMIAVRDARNKAAFGHLFDYFAPRLKGFLMKSGTPGQQAEEIVQDVMLTVWRRAESFDPEKAQVSAWIYQIARNRHIDVLRKEKRPVPDELQQGVEPTPDASHDTAVGQETSLLRAALKHLNADQKSMIEKAYLGEMTHQEISEDTGLPLGTIKSRIRLGMARLKHELKGLR